MFESYKPDYTLCWYKGVCDKANTPACSNSCIRFNSMACLVRDSGLTYNQCFVKPITTIGQDKKAYEWLEQYRKDIFNHVTNGDCLSILSIYPRNGKSTWGCRLLLQYLNSAKSYYYEKPPGMYVSIPDLLRCYQNSWNSNELSEKLSDYTDKLTNADLVVFDNMFLDPYQAYEEKYLRQLFHNRSDHSKSNIVIGRTPGSNVGSLLSYTLYRGDTVEFMDINPGGGK